MSESKYAAENGAFSDTMTAEKVAPAHLVRRSFLREFLRFFNSCALYLRKAKSECRHCFAVWGGVAAVWSSIGEPDTLPQPAGVHLQQPGHLRRQTRSRSDVHLEEVRLYDHRVLHFIREICKDLSRARHVSSDRRGVLLWHNFSWFLFGSKLSTNRISMGLHIL